MDPISSILPRNYPLSIIFLPYPTFSFQTSLSRSNLQKKHRKTFLQPCIPVQFPFSSIPLFSLLSSSLLSFPCSLLSFLSLSSSSLSSPLHTQITQLSQVSTSSSLSIFSNLWSMLLLLPLHENAVIKVMDPFLAAQSNRYFSVLNLPSSSVM